MGNKKPRKKLKPQRIAPEYYTLQLPSHLERDEEERLTFSCRARTAGEYRTLRNAFDDLKETDDDSIFDILDIALPIVDSHLIEIRRDGRRIVGKTEDLLTLPELGELIGVLQVVERLPASSKKKLCLPSQSDAGKSAVDNAENVSDEQSPAPTEPPPQPEPDHPGPI